MQINFKKIIVVIFFFTFFLQSTNVNAMFSPVIGKEISRMRKNVEDFRQSTNYINAKDFLDRIDKNTEKNDEENKDTTAISYISDQAYNITVKMELAAYSAKDPFLDLALIFGSFFEYTGFTPCLRDDIWELETLKEELYKEFNKASYLNDSKYKDILWTDYLLTYAIIYGMDNPTIKDNLQLNNNIFRAGLIHSFSEPYWFNKNQKNYYLSCPYGEFKESFNKVSRVGNKLVTTFSNISNMFSGYLPEMINRAKVKAQERANEWIKKNQINISFSGENKNGRRESLVQGIGGNKAIAEIRSTSSEIINLAKFINPKLNMDTVYNINKIYKEELKTYNLRKNFISKNKEILEFNLEFNNIGEENLKEIESVLIETNQNIENMYKNTENNLQSICENMSTIIKKQCKNHSTEIELCK